MSFQVNQHERKVTQNSQPIDLSKKSFDMLVVLLQRHGELITKNELLKAVWKNQIITDSALNKQISRLRSLFDPPNSTESIIETIRGIGIRFVAEVQIVQPKIPKQQKSKKSLAALLLITVSLFTFVFVLNNKIKRVTPDVTITNTQDVKPLKADKQSINIAIMPAQPNSGWLNIGGLNHLSDLLQQHKEIYSISPQIGWFAYEKSSALSLQMSQSNNIDFALIIENIKQKEQYIAKIKLRNKHGILAEDELQAVSLSMLFKKIDDWAIQQLTISSGIKLTKSEQQNTVSDFALESYLRGITQANNKNLVKATQLFQTALDQNQTFYQAWLSLAEAQAELGFLQSGLAICETIEKLPGFDSNYLNDLYNIKAKILIYLNRFDDAQFLLDKSILISQKSDDMKAMIDSLSSLATLDNSNQETLRILNKRLELIKRYNPLPILIAESYANLAVVNQRMHDYEKAFFHINAAISDYEMLNNRSGLFNSYRISANIHNDSAETGLALINLKKAEQWIEYVQSPIDLANFYMANARNLYEEGYHKQAKQAIQNLKVLSVSYSNNKPKLMALIAQAELEISYKHFERAKNTINQLLEKFPTNTNKTMAYKYNIIAMDMYVTARFKPAKIARAQVKEYLATYPVLNQKIEKTLRRIEAHILIKEGFNIQAIETLDRLMQDYLQEKLYIWAIYIGYELLDLQWQSDDKSSYLKTLNRIQEIVHFDYPILKYKAQYFAYKQDYVNATILLQELKSKAREFWSIDDQLLLEQYKKNTLQ